MSWYFHPYDNSALPGGHASLHARAGLCPGLRKAIARAQTRPQRLGTPSPQADAALAALKVYACEQDAPPGLRLGELLVSKGWLSPGHLEAALVEQRASGAALGAILLQRAWVDPHRLERALSELLLRQGTRRRRRLGEILAQTRQITTWQQRQALRYKPRHESIGQTLCRLGWLSQAQLLQALRLQKRLLRSAACLFLGASLLVACHAPLVPLQLPQAGKIDQLYQTQQLPALAGPFKTLSVDAAGTPGIKIRVYQNGARIIADVPYFSQGNDNTCGQAVVAMLSSFWGQPADYQKLVEQQNPFNLATSAGALVRSMRAQGLEAQEFRNASLDHLIAELNKGRPTAVLLDFGSVQQAHYVVLVGYNPLRETLILHDSLESPYAEIPRQSFVNMWQNDSLCNLLPVAGSNYRRLMVRSFSSH